MFCHNNIAPTHCIILILLTAIIITKSFKILIIILRAQHISQSQGPKHGVECYTSVVLDHSVQSICDFTSYFHTRTCQNISNHRSKIVFYIYPQPMGLKFLPWISKPSLGQEISAASSSHPISSCPAKVRAQELKINKSMLLWLRSAMRSWSQAKWTGQVWNIKFLDQKLKSDKALGWMEESCFQWEELSCSFWWINHRKNMFLHKCHSYSVSYPKIGPSHFSTSATDEFFLSA